MKKHLFLAYDDDNRKRKAQEDWDNLRMAIPSTYGSTKVDHQTFRTTFNRLGAERKIPAAQWKDAYERRLTHVLQKP